MKPLSSRWIFVTIGILIMILLSISTYEYKNSKQNQNVNELVIEGLVEETLAVAEETVKELPQIEISLENEYQTVLERLIYHFDNENLTGVAQVLNSNEVLFQTLFYEGLKGELFLYRDGKAVSQLEGKGMVLLKPSTIFYGTFENGLPNGECVAIQTLNLDSPRYNYSKGIWKDGKMNGYGVTGYDYYTGVTGDEIKGVEKRGNFQDNLMTGDVEYLNFYIEEESARWKLFVEDGIIQKDERFQFQEETNTYQLVAEDDTTHAYIVDEGTFSTPSWRNMVAFMNPIKESP